MRLCFTLLIASAAVRALTPSHVFEAYQAAPAPPCYRQPVLVVTPTSLLALAEGARAE